MIIICVSSLSEILSTAHKKKICRSTSFLLLCRTTTRWWRWPRWILRTWMWVHYFTFCLLSIAGKHHHFAFQGSRDKNIILPFLSKHRNCVNNEQKRMRCIVVKIMWTLLLYLLTQVWLTLNHRPLFHIPGNFFLIFNFLYFSNSGVNPRYITY